MMGVVELAPDDSDVLHVCDNAASERFFGVEPGGTAGRWARRDLGVTAETVKVWARAYHEAQEGGRPVRFPYCFTDGRLAAPERWLEVSVSCLGPGDEGRARFSYTAIDDTERRQGELALRRADQRKDEFLATLAHELRNPLAPIRAGLEVLAGTRNTAEAARARETMERQLQHLVRLIDGLLDIARITQGALTLKRACIDVRAALEHAVEECGPAIQAAGHDLVVAAPDEPIWVEGDATRLAQAVGNLLGNAARYTPRGGRIELSLRADESKAVIGVRDNGAGITPELLPQVFEQFAQGGAARRGGGLGIGLALVKTIVELHGGQVHAASDGPGQGSTFELRVPRVEAPADRVQPRGEAPRPGQRRILVVDDNVDAAEMLAAMLELAGHETRTAYDGPAALDLVERFSFEVAFLDIGLPGMSGYQLAARLRSRPNGERLFLVAITGWGSAEDRRRSHEAGFDAHLTKPVDPRRVSELLARNDP
jgi:signal transduction histidine kinase